MPNNAHADFSPSRLKQIIACPGSYSLTKTALRQNRVIDLPSPAAQHGTLLHEVTDSILKSYFSCFWDQENPQRIPESLIVETGTQFGINSEDIALVDDALGYLFLEFQERVDQCQKLVSYGFETEVTLEHEGLPEVKGTSDAWALFQAEDSAYYLDVFDWKFGRYQVLAHENPQLLAYAYGVLDSVKAYSPEAGFAVTTVHVVQPVIENYQKWTFAPDGKWLNRIRKVVDEALGPNPSFSPSASTCQWCKVAPLCAVHLEQVNETAQTVFLDIQENLKDALWPVEDIKKLLAKLQYLQKASKSILGYFEEQLRAGKPVPGFKLVQGQGRRYWADEQRVCEFFEKRYPQVDLFDAKLRSPAQLEKYLPAKERKAEDFQALINTVHGLKMVPDEASGAPVFNAEEAFKEFK